MFCDITSQCSQENKFFGIFLEYTKNQYKPVFIHGVFFTGPSPQGSKYIKINLAKVDLRLHRFT